MLNLLEILNKEIKIPCAGAWDRYRLRLSLVVVD